MRKTIAVQPAMLRSASGDVARANEPHPRLTVDTSRLGTPATRWAVEDFEQYWGDAQSSLTEALAGMHAVLASAATVYEARDRQSATAFGGDARAV